MSRVLGGRGWCAPVVLCGISITMGGSPTPLAAQEAEDCPVRSGLHVGPALIVSEAGDLRPAVEGVAGVCRTLYSFGPDFPRTTYFQGSVDGMVALADIRAPQQVKASLGLGMTTTLARENPAGGIEDDRWLFFHGYLGVAVRGVYEASTDLDEQAFTGGAELRYVDPSRPFLPSLVIAGDFVMPTRSESRAALGLDEESFRRLMARAYWLIPVGSRITAEIDGSLFRTQGLEAALRAIGWSSGEAVSASLAYGPLLTVRSITVESLWVRFTTGQVPVNQTNLKAFTIGLRLGTRDGSG